VDRIFLNTTFFQGLGDVGEVVSESRFAIGAPQDSSDRLIYDPATGELIYDADGNGAGQGIVFAQLDAGLEISAELFLLVN
jgi:serralysin